MVLGWVRRCFHRESEQSASEESASDYYEGLPSDRPRMTRYPLIPREHAISRASLMESATEAMRDSGLFNLVPYEIRRMILIEAFGGRVVHVDLRPNYPLRPLNHASVSDVRTHGGFSAPLREALGGNPDSLHYRPTVDALPQPTGFRRRDMPPEWQWWSCVCHCPVNHSGFPIRRAGRPPEACLWGDQVDCGRWFPGDTCFLGVMGWLLTSRKAYSEGIDVLYSTNTFFFDTKTPLFTGLQQKQLDLPRSLLLPHHWAAIRSLELLFEFQLFTQNQDGRQTRDRAAFHKCLRHLEFSRVNFPSLNSLYLGFGKSLYARTSEGPARCIPEIESEFMGPISRLVRVLGPPMTSIAVDIPRAMYWALADRAPVKERRSHNIFKCHWETVPSSSQGTDDGPEGANAAGGAKLGYWIGWGTIPDTDFGRDGKPAAFRYPVCRIEN